MTDWEKQLENIDPKDISIIFVSAKTYEMLRKAAKTSKLVDHKTGFFTLSFKGIPITPSKIPQDDEFIIVGKQIQWLVDLMEVEPLATPISWKMTSGW